MANANTTKAESRLADMRRRSRQVLKDADKERQQRVDLSAKLRAQRLARDAAEMAAADDGPGHPAKGVDARAGDVDEIDGMGPDLPKAHRRAM